MDGPTALITLMGMTIFAIILSFIFRFVVSKIFKREDLKGKATFLACVIIFCFLPTVFAVILEIIPLVLIILAKENKKAVFEKWLFKVLPISGIIIQVIYIAGNLTKPV